MNDHWWLDCKWAMKHRHTIGDIHPLLVKLLEARGHAYITVERVQALLKARDPEYLVNRWAAHNTIPGERM